MPHIRGHHQTDGTRQPLKEISNPASTLPSRPDYSKTVTTVFKTSPHPRNGLGNVLPELDGQSASTAICEKSAEQHRASEVAADHEQADKRNSGVSTASTNASGRRRKAFIGHWQLGKTIGKGGCSRVRVVRHRFREQYGAVKIITRSTAESTRAQSLANLSEVTRSNAAHPAGYKPIPFGLEREIAIMRLLEHQNIVRLYDVWENSNELYLIMEYADGGELFHYVDQRKGLPEGETVYIFRQIVSALLYCHRLRICHRDLKPENILLNQRDLTVKIIDFGMAALQPEGRLLSTPCGSPHYAAPEVVSGRPYDGTLADVWSCGVILYVMLTGTAPYNYAPDGDIRGLFRDIARARYYMPPELSLEAKDLLRRIFVPDPKVRVSMDDVWDHALLHKYDSRFGYEGQAGSKEAAVGSIPTIEDWKVQHSQDIDREILRNMRTLWHSETEQGLIHKLLNDDYNQEKLFYAALLKHREEHLENFVGESETMDYATSDYHHSGPRRQASSVTHPQNCRSHSQYSIMNDEHLRPSNSFIEPPPSIESYDPYRGSQDHWIKSRPEYVSAGINRVGSTKHDRGIQGGRSLRHPNPLRIEMLKQGNRRVSIRSAASLPRSARSRASIQRSSASKHSMTSTVWASSPPVIATMRPSSAYKRGVSFSHLRRRSTTNTLPQTSPDKDRAPTTPDTARNKRQKTGKQHGQTTTEEPPSPIQAVTQAIRSRKAPRTDAGIQDPHGNYAQSSRLNIRSEIRKHSVELEKACEEAFFRSSMASNTTVQTTRIERQSLYETPPSSISGFPQVDEVVKSEEPLLSQRSVAQDTPKTYLSRTLEETREKLAAYQTLDHDSTAGFDEVMKLLESLVTSVPPRHPEIRNFSAPETKSTEVRAQLPIISEETDLRAHRDTCEGRNWKRSVTAPSPTSKFPADKTVRIVNSTSPMTTSIPKKPSRTSITSSNNLVDDDDLPNRPYPNISGHSRASIRATSLPAISEDGPATGPEKLRQKRSGWFGLGKKSGPGAYFERKEQAFTGELASEAPPQDSIPVPAHSGNLMNAPKKQSNSKKTLSRWLARKTPTRDESAVIDGESAGAVGTPRVQNGTGLEPVSNKNKRSEAMFPTGSPSLGIEEKMSENGQGRSWFARFFHIKPLTKVLCFSIPRNRARQELVILLREWQRHGIRDLQFCRETHTITARVDRENALSLKPVSFRIELFVVLEHGRKVGLSIARVVQVRGAASGFRKVVEVIDGVMRGRGWMVEDEEKCRALSEVVGV